MISMNMVQTAYNSISMKYAITLILILNGAFVSCGETGSENLCTAPDLTLMDTKNLYDVRHLKCNNTRVCLLPCYPGAKAVAGRGNVSKGSLSLECDEHGAPFTIAEGAGCVAKSTVHRSLMDQILGGFKLKKTQTNKHKNSAVKEGGRSQVLSPPIVSDLKNSTLSDPSQTTLEGVPEPNTLSTERPKAVKTTSGATAHSRLMDQIRGGVKLKKTQTNKHTNSAVKEGARSQVLSPPIVSDLKNSTLSDPSQTTPEGVPEPNTLSTERPNAGKTTSDEKLCTAPDLTLVDTKNLYDVRNLKCNNTHLCKLPCYPGAKAVAGRGKVFQGSRALSLECDMNGAPFTIAEGAGCVAKSPTKRVPTKKNVSPREKVSRFRSQKSKVVGQSTRRVPENKPVDFVGVRNNTRTLNNRKIAQKKQNDKKKTNNMQNKKKRPEKKNNKNKKMRKNRSREKKATKKRRTNKNADEENFMTRIKRFVESHNVVATIFPFLLVLLCVCCVRYFCASKENSEKKRLGDAGLASEIGVTPGTTATNPREQIGEV